MKGDYTMKEIKEEDKNHDFVQMYRDNLETLSFLSTNKLALNLFMLLPLLLTL